jgi:carboxymethylenebutenolidase
MGSPLEPAGPPSDSYDDVRRELVQLTARDGVTLDAELYRPTGAAQRAGVVIGAEGTGINHFIRRVAATLAHLGFVVIVPDPYRGAGPRDPEAYEDVETLMSYIGALDFVRATTDLLAAADHLRGVEAVDDERVAMWGYCTGATLALLAAELDPRTAAAVLFYPSQPTFDALDERKPTHPIDLLWALDCPVLIHYGDADVVMPPALLDELRRRLDVWHIDHELQVYPGAGHAFCAETPMFFDRAAAETGWRTSVEFLERALKRT